MFAPNGVLLGEGQTVKRIQLGNTLRKIAEQGAIVFYEVSFSRKKKSD
jgi:gamma-glutamyltranspeptidase